VQFQSQIVTAGAPPAEQAERLGMTVQAVTGAPDPAVLAKEPNNASLRRRPSRSESLRFLRMTWAYAVKDLRFPQDNSGGGRGTGRRNSSRAWRSLGESAGGAWRHS
jgi:hypothetical protein